MKAELPTRKQEPWRYSDLKALANAYSWPLAANQPEPFDTLLEGRLERLVTTNEGATYEAGRFEVRPNSTAVLVETLEGSGFLESRLNLDIGAGARVLHIFCQSRGAASVTYASRNVQLDAGAHYSAFILNLGGQYGRLALDVLLEGVAAQASLNVLQLGFGAQTLEVVSHIAHARPSAISTQNIVNIAAVQATTSYLGKITVAKEAQQTQAAQNAKGLLLARTATINVKPELEIYADDVKCAHGASIGALDPQALFYLQSRGLTPDQAQQMLIEAFMSVLFETLTDPAAQTALQAAASARLEQLWGG
jgi:Fe-S cluster assembly protein SufD